MSSLVNSFWFALKNFVDNFNRSTTSNLGTSSGGQPWTALRGTWFANGTQGRSDDNAATYPIASYDIGIADTTSRIDVSGPGVGVAFWVTDANSWWAAYPFYDTTSSTSTTCNAGLVSNASNPPSGSCCSGVSSNSSTTCSGGYVINTSNPPSGSCCSGVDTYPGTAGSTYAATATTTQGYSYSPTVSTTGGGYCCAAQSVGRTGTSGNRTPTCADYPSCECNETYTALYLCCGDLLITTYSCYYPTTTTYSCPSGGTYNSTTGQCEVPSSTTYSCPNGGTLSGTTCTIAATATQYGCYTQNVTSTTYSCYTQTTSTTTFTYRSHIRIISSVSGSVATDSTTLLASSGSTHPNIASIDVITSGNTITAKGYSSAGQVTQLGSTVTRTPTSPNRGTSIGIIKAPTDTGQASTVDNYSVSV